MLLKKLFHQTPNQIPENQRLLQIHTYYLNFAKDILASPFYMQPQNELMKLNALNKLIKVLTLDIENHILLHTISVEHDYPFSSTLFLDSPVCPKCGRLNNCTLNRKKIVKPIAIDISMHPTISCPWNKTRLMNAFGSIGVSVDNPYIFDKNNHFSGELYAPLNLTKIHNGYHSSACGIYDTNAIYYPEYFCDFYDFYDEIYFDGMSFRHKACRSVIETPEPKSLGTIYEIGRLLYEHNLSLLTLLKTEIITTDL